MLVLTNQQHTEGTKENLFNVLHIESMRGESDKCYSIYASLGRLFGAENDMAIISD